MTGVRPFHPGSPIQPFDGYSTTPRSHDYPAGYNIAARPRRNERVAFDTLRGLIEAYDVAQMCIWHRVDSIRSLPWSLVAAPGEEGQDLSRWIDIGMSALRRPDRRHSFKTWLATFVYDILAYDAGSLYRMRNNANRCIGLKVVDGTTIAPLLDYYGDTPQRETPDDPAPPAFVQYAQGVPWNWLTTDDLIYEPFRLTSSSPYGKAPIETILLNSNTDLRFQLYFLQRFTDGNIPEGFATAPEGWTPNQIEEFQDAWDSFMDGAQEEKNRIRWVPNGTGFAWSNEKEFTDTFSLFLMRKTAAAYHVTPQDLGFTDDVNRATSETQVDNQFRVGDLPLIEHVQGILDGFLQDDLGLPLEFQFDTGQEKEDRLATAQADKIYVEAGVVSASEVRERVYGLSEPDGQMVPRFIFSNRAGPIPLSALMAVAGPTDPVDGAPVPGEALPHKPFALVEGVAPQEPPKTPPLAVVRYPEDNPASVIAAEQNANAAVAKATEARTFDRFVRARETSGAWRDFRFEHHDELEAHRLNQAGRATIRKAAGEIVAAGLAVRAEDTGRVLMLQRAFDDDTAGGMWEFPGGCLDEGETALNAAVREWQEETGLLLPVDVVLELAAGGRGWTSPDGVYRGYTVDVPDEASVDILDRGRINPDDPDGDNVEALAWWDPTTIPGNPNVRGELSVTDAVLPALVPGATSEPPEVLAEADAAATAAGVVKADDAGPKGPPARGGTARRRSRNTASTSA
jgi:8-oxo-dGTP pyrophosphatase MutT (NUDIX family)